MPGPDGPADPPVTGRHQGRRFDSQTVLTSALVVYVTSVLLLSPDLPRSVAALFGMKPTEALVALIVVPCIAGIVIRIAIARNDAQRRRRGS